MRRLLLLLLSAASFSLNAQGSGSDTENYKGLRLGLFRFTIEDESARSVALRCDVANTGRYALHFDARQGPPAALVMEMDTLGLPASLRGRENQVAAAVQREAISLAPGEIRSRMLLRVVLDPRSAPAATPALPSPPDEQPLSCGDLTFDTAFLVRHDAQRAVLHFVLRNTGREPMKVADRRKEIVSINAYFVRDTQLTRGAALAAAIVLTENKSCPDGILPPGAVLEGDVPVGLSTRTRFNPNIVLEIAPSTATCEQNLTNNTRAVVLEF